MEDDSKQQPDLKELGALWAASVSEDLSGLFGKPVLVSPPAVEEATRDALLGSEDPVVCSSCGERLYVVLSLRAALVLATAQLGKDPNDVPAPEPSSFEGEVEQAYKSAMDICVGIFGRVLDEEAGLPSVALVESVLVKLPVSGSVPAAGTYRRARFAFEIEGFPKEGMDILFESERAAEWFGASAGGSEAAVDLRAIALIDPDPESRAAFAALAEELGRDVLTLDPAELGNELCEELAETSSVVLTWDLGGRLGLDVLETLSREEQTANLRIAIATSAPTRAMIDVALRWGAHTVLFQPWDAAEISERLLS